MCDSKFWRVVAVMFVAGLFYSANNDVANPLPSFSGNAIAGATVANENTEVVFTCSQDGRKIYMWRYFSSKPPKFMGEADAVLSQ